MSTAIEALHYTGNGPDKERQEASHAHCATASPDNHHVLINDLGLDCIHIYKLDAVTARLTPNDPPAYKALPKSGPRSFVFHPNGRVAYSTNELSNTVDVLAWDAAAGTLTRVQNITTVAEGLTELAASRRSSSIAGASSFMSRTGLVRIRLPSSRLNLRQEN